MVHQGHNVKRIREILGIKQDALAIKLGLSQQAVSQLEQKEKPLMDSTLDFQFHSPWHVVYTMYKHTQQ